jgi:hypothetical protein
VAFWLWTGLYFTTPFLVPLAWLRNRRTDPGTLESADDRYIWPWRLDELGAATLGAWFALPGVTALMMGIDGRSSAIRITLESQLIGLALILLGTGRAWEQFDKSNALTYVFAGGIALLLVGLAALWSSIVRRRPHAPARSADPAVGQPAQAQRVVRSGGAQARRSPLGATTHQYPPLRLTSWQSTCPGPSWA